MPTKPVNLETIFEKYSILLGGVGPTVEISEFNDTEYKLFVASFDYIKEQFNRISPTLANDVIEQKDLILTFAKIFKAKIGEKTFGGLTPSSGQFGMGPLIPQDIKYVATPSDDEPAYTDYNGHDWTLSLTAGTPVYLLGDSTHFYKSSPTVGKRAMFVILKNGIIEVGTTPKLNQIKLQTEKIDYTPIRLNILADIPIEKEKPIYQYITPMAIPVWYDFGIKISAMPYKPGTSDIRLMGVVFYEYNYYKELRY